MTSLKPTQPDYDDLFTDIQRGLILIPQFQREFVWSRAASAALLDSIVKGYPIGAFIFWKTRERMRSIKSLGGLDFKTAAEGSEIAMVIDGQQRLTSLFAAIKGQTIKRDKGGDIDFSEIYVDLKAEDGAPVVAEIFEFLAPGRYIKLTVLVEGDFDILAKYPEIYKSEIKRIRKRLEKYPFPVIELSDAPIEVATEVFERLNVGGRTLTNFEIMVAKTYDETCDFDLSKKFKHLVKALKPVGYDTLNASTVLQVVSILENGALKGKAILNIKQQAFIETYPIAEKAIRDAIDYLRDSFRIPASRLLPYTALIVPFAYFFAKNKSRRPSPKQAKLLKKLFWMVSLGERYSGAAETRLEQDISRIDRILVSNAPDYDWTVNVTTKALLDRGKFKINSAYTKAILCLFAEQKPVDLLDANSEVRLTNDYLQQSNSRNFHHFFPKDHLKGSDYDPNNVMNITFIRDWENKKDIRHHAPSMYLAKFAKMNKEMEKSLSSHLIGDREKFGLTNDDYPKFLKARAKMVRDELRRQLR